VRGKVLDLDDALVELAVAEQNAKLCADGIRAPEHALQGAAAAVEIDDDAAFAQASSEEQPLRDGALADRRDEATGFTGELALSQCEKNALEPQCEPDGRHTGPTELLESWRRSGAAAEGVLGAERPGGRLNLEERSRVVVEPANEPGFDAVWHTQRIEMPAEPLPVGAIGVVQNVEDRRRRGRELLILRVLRVEDAERIVVEPLTGVLAELRGVRHQVLLQEIPGNAHGCPCCPGCSPAPPRLDAEAREEAVEHVDHLGIGGRSRVAEHLATGLVNCR